MFCFWFSLVFFGSVWFCLVFGLVPLVFFGSAWFFLVQLGFFWFSLVFFGSSQPFARFCFIENVRVFLMLRFPYDAYNLKHESVFERRVCSCAFLAVPSCVVMLAAVAGLSPFGDGGSSGGCA